MTRTKLWTGRNAMSGRRRGGERILIGSLGALIQDYRKSSEYDALKKSTKVLYERAMGHLHPLYRSELKDIRRRHVKRLRDKYKATPAAANHVVGVLSTLMAYAVDMELVDANPCARVKKLKVGQRRPWTDGEIDFALRTLPEMYRRAIVLAVYTGQRLADVLAMRWSDYDGQGIAVAQQKTGERIWVPCHPALQAEIEAWKREGRSAVTILVNNLGQPHKVKSFTANVCRELRKHLELTGAVFHGLRVTAATRLAEAGASTHEIAAVTGHRTLAMVQHYTSAADQRKRATSAIAKLGPRTYGAKP